MDMDTETNQKVTRQAEYAGKFYSGSAKELKAEVEKYCREGKPPLFPQRFPGALIVPHAGYVFIAWLMDLFFRSLTLSYYLNGFGFRRRGYVE